VIRAWPASIGIPKVTRVCHYQRVRDSLQQALGNGFTLQRELGGGNMARVFLATDERLGRTVVVKVLPPELADGTSAERFRREIRVVASLRHPHIVPLLDAGGTDSLLFYSMPYIEGESLRGLLKREGRLPEEKAVRFAAEIAGALIHAHASGIVHRDIKPENILIDGDHAVVTDFGIARAVQRPTTAITTAGVAIGTTGYMSPEQATGMPDIDARTDTYSLGCLLLEMLTGASPLGGLAALNVAGGISESVREILERALAPNPDDRYATTREFRDALLGSNAAKVSRRVTQAAIAAAVILAAAALVVILK
jgi:serine/threonine protein kinase